jgi:hypothetical protein
LKPGHPFQTSELDAQRVRQRRAFRFIRDWIIKKVKTDSTPGPLADAALIETELRRLADEDLAALAPDLKERERYGRLSVVTTWL